MSDSQSNQDFPLSPFSKPTPKSYLFNKKLQKLQSVDRQIRRKWAIINTQNRKRDYLRIKQQQERQRSFQHAQHIIKQSKITINNPLSQVILGHRVNKIERQKQQRKQVAAMLRNKYYEQKLYGKPSQKHFKSAGKKKTAVSYKIKRHQSHIQPLARKCSQLTNQIQCQQINATQGMLLQSKRQRQGFTLDINQKTSERRIIAKTQADQQFQIQRKSPFGKLNKIESKKQISKFFRVKSEHLERLQSNKSQCPSKKNLQCQVPIWLQKRSPKKIKLLQIISSQYKDQLQKMNRQSHMEADRYTDSKICLLNKIKGGNTKLYYKLIAPWKTKDFYKQV